MMSLDGLKAVNVSVPVGSGVPLLSFQAVEESSDLASYGEAHLFVLPEVGELTKAGNSELIGNGFCPRDL